MRRSELAIPLAPMAYAHDEHHKHAVVDRVDHAVVAHANAVQILRPLELFHAGRSGGRGERINRSGDPALHRPIECREVLQRRRANFDAVGQSETERRLGFRPCDVLAL